MWYSLGATDIACSLPIIWYENCKQTSTAIHHTERNSEL